MSTTRLTHRGKWLAALGICALGLGAARWIAWPRARTVEPIDSTDVLYTKRHEEDGGRL